MQVRNYLYRNDFVSKRPVTVWNNMRVLTWSRQQQVTLSWLLGAMTKNGLHLLKLLCRTLTSQYFVLNSKYTSVCVFSNICVRWLTYVLTVRRFRNISFLLPVALEIPGLDQKSWAGLRCSAGGHVETQTMQTADCADRADWVLFLLVPNFLVDYLS